MIPPAKSDWLDHKETFRALHSRRLEHSLQTCVKYVLQKSGTSVDEILKKTDYNWGGIMKLINVLVTHIALFNVFYRMRLLQRHVTISRWKLFSTKNRLKVN